MKDMSLIRWSLVFGLGGRQSTFLVLTKYFSFGLDFFGRKLTYNMNTICSCILSTLFQSHLHHTVAYLIPEIGTNDFNNTYFEGASPQTAIDEILPKSLNLVDFVVEVKETCQQPLYLTQME